MLLPAHARVNGGLLQAFAGWAGRSDALGNVQLQMLSIKDRSHPFYWASFIPVGNWEKLDLTGAKTQTQEPQ